ncbi:tuftelin 1a isoform X1 [Polypterus senegalus]|uniref:tuftelin 1a isoform X1 n=1 Tax=Polypterus senegalus TaxID=55291 RepID=UPI00196290CF|nr:tuftelin 1a isoform X1 [Polypterus senegalus]
MNAMSRTYCTYTDLTENASKEYAPRLRLTLQDQTEDESQSRMKPIGRVSALTPSQSANELPSSPLWNSEPVKPTEEKVEIIKVYLEARNRDQAKHEKNMKMLTDEVSQIQEVRYCLKNLRQQMASRASLKHEDKRPDSDGLRTQSRYSSAIPTGLGATPMLPESPECEDSEKETDKMRELTKKLYSQYYSKLQEAEQRHQAERTKLEEKNANYQKELNVKQDALKLAEEGLSERDSKIYDLHRLLSSMEKEQHTLLIKMKEHENQLVEMKTLRKHSAAQQERSAQLEKEVATLKEKIHHLDDMLKSQQRKVRHMIEQLQNSKTLIRDKDALIQSLQEKVSFLEAENKEMHDRLEYFLENQKSASSPVNLVERLESNHSKPTSPSQPIKPLPYIKVIQMRS